LSSAQYNWETKAYGNEKVLSSLVKNNETGVSNTSTKEIVFHQTITSLGLFVYEYKALCFFQLVVFTANTA
jgi:hypothetical protein